MTSEKAMEQLAEYLQYTTGRTVGMEKDSTDYQCRRDEAVEQLKAGKPANALAILQEAEPHLAGMFKAYEPYQSESYYKNRVAQLVSYYDEWRQAFANDTNP